MYLDYQYNYLPNNNINIISKLKVVALLPETKIIDNRSSLHEYLDLVFEQNKDMYQEYGELEFPYLKTYLIESNYPEDYNFSKEVPDGVKVIKTKDEGFYRFSSKENKNMGFLDLSRERIWQYYSLEKSEKSDAFIKTWVDGTINLDRCWQNNNVLNKYEKEYVFRGIGIVYDDLFTESNKRNRLSLKLWTQRDLSDYEHKIYSLVRQNYRRRSTRIQDLDSEDNTSNFLNEIYFDGKITSTYAKSSEYIFEFNNKVIDRYLNILNIIEERRGIFGDPIEIIFKNKIDIKRIYEFFNSGKLPFRLMLLKLKEKIDFVSMYGLDLHTHQPIGIDVGEDYIWINIPKKTCGNSGTRIPTLLGFSIEGKEEITIGGELLFD